ncbi:Glycosyl phosphatidyl inositol protein transamidase complex subunit, partial [Rhizopus azygosporus]
MLVSKLKEKWLTKDGKTVDLEKQARILRFLQRITPVITFLLFFAGVIWILVLPHEKYNKGTYISENALLPGQANVEYGYNDIRTAEDYVQKLIGIQDKDSETRAQFIHEEFRQSG